MNDETQKKLTGSGLTFLQKLSILAEYNTYAKGLYEQCMSGKMKPSVAWKKAWENQEDLNRRNKGISE